MEGCSCITIQVSSVAFTMPRCFEAGSFLPLPSREAVEKSIGKGGNGTISIVYYKGVEFAVKGAVVLVGIYTQLTCDMSCLYVCGICVIQPITHVCQL